jgi:hypothetical protein
MALPTMIAGMSKTSNLLSNQQVVDMADKIYLLEPNAAPLYEDELNPSWSTLSMSAAAGDTVLSATDDIFNKFDLVKIPSTGEVVLVTAKATRFLTVTRTVGATDSGAITSASDIVIIGSAFAEGSSATDLTTMSTKTAVKTNYLQIFRKSVEISKTLANSELLNLGALSRNR